MCVPSGRHRLAGGIAADEHLGERGGTAGVHDVPVLQIACGLCCRAGEHAMGGEEIVTSPAT